jgi:hypothetical protein
MERMNTEDPNSDKLSGLLAAYRDACPDPEPSREFMPNLWSKIEARQVEKTTSIFRHLAQACVAATLAVVILTTVLTPSAPDDEILYSSTYADILAADHADQAYVDTLPAHVLGDGR